jgi:hypothetical protein
MTAYVYAITVDGVPRYIGKGSGIPMKRAQEHIRTAKRIIKRRQTGEVFWASRLYNKLARAISSGSEVRAVCIISNLTDEQAFDRERVEIEIAAPGQLWNLDGGGLGGKKISEAHRAKMSEAAKRRWARPGELDRLRAFANRAENIARLKATNGELARRPEVRAKNSHAAKMRWRDPEKAARMKVGLGKRWSRSCPGQLEFSWERRLAMKT